MASEGRKQQRDDATSRFNWHCCNCLEGPYNYARHHICPNLTCLHTRCCYCTVKRVEIGSSRRMDTQNVRNEAQSNRSKEVVPSKLTSCSECARRKQKCNKGQPCNHCKRRYPAVACIYPAGKVIPETPKIESSLAEQEGHPPFKNLPQYQSQLGVLSEPEYSLKNNEHGLSPYSKAMLSEAVTKAKTAVLLDNTLNHEGAIQAYFETCDILQDALFHILDEEDRRKLEAIRDSYMRRVKELENITHSVKEDSKALSKQRNKNEEDQSISLSPEHRADGEDKVKATQIIRPMACFRCHERRVYCDKKEPCSRCSEERPPLNCIYPQIEKIIIPQVNYSRMSCVRCRRRKLKCDKARPCARCAISGDDCVYPSPILGREQQLRLADNKKNDIEESMLPAQSLKQDHAKDAIQLTASLRETTPNDLFLSDDAISLDGLPLEDLQASFEGTWEYMWDTVSQGEEFGDFINFTSNPPPEVVSGKPEREAYRTDDTGPHHVEKNSSEDRQSIHIRTDDSISQSDPSPDTRAILSRSSSLASIANSLFSDMTGSSKSSFAGPEGATERLVSLLLSDRFIKENCLRIMNSAKSSYLENSLRKLLKELGVELREEADTKPKRNAAYFVRSRARNSAYMICDKIRGEIENISLSDFPQVGTTGLAADADSEQSDSDHTDDEVDIYQYEEFIKNSVALKIFIERLKEVVQHLKGSSLTRTKDMTQQQGVEVAPSVEDTETDNMESCDVEVTNKTLIPEIKVNRLSVALEEKTSPWPNPIWRFHLRIKGWITSLSQLMYTPLPNGKIRVEWECRCGQKIWDDFQELTPGAAEFYRKSLIDSQRIEQALKTDMLPQPVSMKMNDADSNKENQVTRCFGENKPWKDVSKTEVPADISSTYVNYFNWGERQQDTRCSGDNELWKEIPTSLRMSWDILFASIFSILLGTIVLCSFIFLVRLADDVPKEDIFGSLALLISLVALLATLKQAYEQYFPWTGERKVTALRRKVLGGIRLLWSSRFRHWISTYLGLEHVLYNKANLIDHSDSENRSIPKKFTRAMSNGIDSLRSLGSSITWKSSNTDLPLHELQAPGPRTQSAIQSQIPLTPPPELLFLLLCYSEGRYATKLLQLDLVSLNAMSDKLLFQILRSNYHSMRGKWLSKLSLRTLAWIKFVNFEMYPGELVDVRKVNDIPPPEHADYKYAPAPPDVIPPIGDNHLMHLFHNPSCATDNPLCLSRFPKKLKQKLLCNGGINHGWGLQFVESWDVKKIWLLAFVFFALGSMLFGILWAVFEHNIQDAFAIAGYIVAFAALSVGSFQALTVM